MPQLRTFAAGTGALLVAVLLLVAGALVALDYGWQRERLRAFAEQQLAQALGTGVRIGRIDGVLHRAPMLAEIEIAGAPDRILLGVRSLHLQRPRLSPRAPHLHFDLVRAEGLRAELARDAEGRWNFEGLAGSDSPETDGSPAPILRVAALEIAGAELLVHWQSNDAGGFLASSVDARVLDLQLPDAAQAQVEISARLDAGRVADLALETGVLRAKTTGGAWILEELELRAPGLSLQASGNGTPDGLEALELRAASDALERLAAWLPGDASGAIDVQGTLRGDFDALVADVRASGRSLALGELALGDLTLEARADGEWTELHHFALQGGGLDVVAEPGARLRLRDGGARIENLRLATAEQTFAIDGRVATERFDQLRVRAVDVDVAPLARAWDPALDASGRISADLVIDGPRLTPRLDGEASWIGVAAGGVALGDLRLALQSDDDVQSLRAALSSGDASAAGADLELELPRALAAAHPTEPWRWAADPDFRLRADARDLELAPIGELAQLEGLRGKLDAQIELAGGEWIELHRFALQGGGLDVVAEPGARLRLRDGAARIENLRLAAAEQTFAIDGGVDAERFDQLRVRAVDVEVAPLARAWDPELDASGRISADLVIDGPRLTPRLDGEASWIGVAAGGVALGDLRLALQSDDHVQSLRAALSSGDASGAELELDLPRALAAAQPTEPRRWAADPGFRLRADARELELAPIGELAQLEGLRGKLDAQIEIAGGDPLPQLHVLALTAKGLATATLPASDLSVRLVGNAPGSAVLETLQLESEGEKLAALPGAVLRSSADTLVLDDLVLVARDQQLVLDGSIPAPPVGLPALLASPKLDLGLRTDEFSIEALAHWLPQYARNPAGLVDAELRVRGARPRPRVDGWLEVHEGGVDVPLLGRRFEPIEVRAELDDEELQLRTLRVGTPERHAHLSGRVALPTDGDPQVALQLELRDFPWAETALAKAGASGSGSVVGPLRRLDLTGELTLTDVDVRVLDASDPTLREIRVLASDRRAAGDAPTQAERSLTEIVDGASIDLALALDEGARIRGRGLDLALEGNVAYRKPRAGIGVYSGSLRSPRGSYRLHGKRFAVQRGVLALDGPELDPRLDVEAVHEAGDVAIIALITGRASEPRVRLESRPSMSEEDVLSQLLFGRSMSEATASQRAAAESAAAQVASGMLLGELESLFGTDLPIESFELRIAEDGSVEELGVGGSLGERIYLRYGRTIGVDPEDRASVEIRLIRNFSVSSDVTSSGRAGADLIWRLDY